MGYSNVVKLIEENLDPVIDIVLEDEQEEQLVKILEKVYIQAQVVAIKADDVVGKLIENIKARRSTEV